MNRIAIPSLLYLLLAAGCATAPDPAEYRQENPDGLPVHAVFVYDETVHAAGPAFSTDSWFWQHAYPEAAQSVRTADRAESYDEALTTGADLIVVVKNQVYGTREIFKTSLVFYIRDRDRNLLSETGYQGKQTTADQASTTFTAIGRMMRDHIRSARHVRTYVREVERRDAMDAFRSNSGSGQP